MNRFAQLGDRGGHIVVVEACRMVLERFGKSSPGKRGITVMDAVKIEMEQTERKQPRQREIPRVERIADRRRVVIHIVKKRDQERARRDRGGEERPIRSVTESARAE